LPIMALYIIDLAIVFLRRNLNIQQLTRTQLSAQQGSNGRSSIGFNIPNAALPFCLSTRMPF